MTPWPWTGYRVMCGDCGYCGPWHQKSWHASFAEFRHHRDYPCRTSAVCVEARNLAEEEWLTGTTDPELPLSFSRYSGRARS